MPAPRTVIGLIAWVFVCFAAGITGAQFLPGDWYAGLVKPSWTPPNWVFGPVWSLLYLMMGIAAWRVWREFGFGGAPIALALFGIQLVLNTTWSYLFFGRHAMGLAAAEIVLLWIAIFATTIAFRPRSTLAAALMVPYLLWVTYAATLNFGLWHLN